MTPTLKEKIRDAEDLRLTKEELKTHEFHIKKLRNQVYMLNGEIRQLKEVRGLLKYKIAKLSEKLGVKQNDE